MAQILDKQGLQHYANKMCNADNRKVGSKNLPTALNEIDIAIDGFKTLFETEYGSALDMKLENNENVFSVGTGTNVDKRSEVENSFTDIELNGNSLVNIYGKGFSDIANIENGSGTIVDNGYYKIVANGDFRNAFLSRNMFPLKPNTIYTVVMFVRKETLVGSKYFNLSDGAYDSPFEYSDILLNGVGVYTKKVVTVSDFNSTDCCFRGYIAPQTTSGELEFKVMLLEGDWTNKPIPQYFEGLKSVGEKENGNHKISISSVGKNLCPYNNAEFQANETRPWIDMLGVEGIYGSNVANRTRTWFYLSEGKYKLSYKTENCIIQVIDKNENLLNFSNNFKGGYVCVRIKSSVTSGRYSVKDLQIELSETQTHYEPYKEDKKEISLNEPLRGLPNGIRDTIEKINGEWKIVRRCGEIIFNGEENWTLSDHNGETTSRYRLDYPKITDIAKKVNSIGICDTIPVYSNGYWREDFEMIENDAIYISIRKKIYNNLNEFKEWLSQNPTKVIYELATPIIEDVSPITLQCWKNGTISIDEVLPVESTHTVALNKSAQIQKNIEELSILRNRVETLEKQYNNSTLNQAYELELLRFDMELDNIV